MGFSTRIFIYVISRLRMWKSNLYTDPGSLNAPTLMNKNVPLKADQTSAGKKKCHHHPERAQGRAAGAGLPT